MKIKSTLLAFFVLATATLFAQSKQDRKVGDFTGIEVSSAFEVFLRMGSTNSVTVIADADFIDHIKTKVEAGVLEVDFDDDWTMTSKPKTPMKIYITANNLKNIELGGACKLETKNTLTFPMLNIGLSGASTATVAVEVTNLNLDFSGAAKASISGKAQKVTMDGSGASILSAKSLETTTMALDLSGASKADVNVSEKLVVEASGASNVRYTGNPSLEQDISGAASVTKY